MKLVVGIPSRERPHRVEPMEKLCGDLKINWFVPGEEFESYTVAGATRVHPQVPGHNFSKLLNQIVDYAQERGAWAAIFDDDLSRLDSYIPGTDRKVELIKPKVAILRVASAMQRNGARLGGISAQNNRMFAMQGWERWGDCHPRVFIRSSFMVIAPDMDLRFDPALRTRMDYAMTIQNVAKYGLVCRVDGIIPTWGYKTNAGGFQRPERVAWDTASEILLKKRYPQYVISNKRRPGEILISKWPAKGTSPEEH